MYISLKTKIVTIITLFFAFVLFLNMLYSLNYSKVQLNKYLNNLNTSSAKLLNKNIRGDLYNLNYSNVKNTINSFDNEYFQNIYILDKDGNIFAQRDKDEIELIKYKNFDKLIKSKNSMEFVYVEDVSILNNTLGYIVIENNNKIFEELKKEKRDEILRLFGILLLITVVISYFISLIITNPIYRIIENIKAKNFNFKHSNDEYGYLSKVIEENYKNIQNLNLNLEKIVQKEIKKNRDKDKILQEQSLRASMGGMMDAVAHQWMQPLNIVKIISQDLDIRTEFDTVTQEDIKKANKNICKQVDHMTDTLNEFRSFFRVDKMTENILIEDVIESTLLLLKNDINKNDIQISVDCLYKKEIEIIPNEFKHVLINIINNAKDAFISNEIKDRKIDINIYQKENKVKIELQDNAGGVPKNIINNIFDINITSKVKGEGTGIGLYLSKMIIHKINGEIEVKNKNGGACFTITLNA